MKKYRYVLLSNDSGRRIDLEHSPEAWDAQKINIVKDLTYFGVLKSFSVEFYFVGDGYKFLQNEYLRFGCDADVIFRLYKKNEFIFQGKINFQNFNDDRKSRKFKIDIIQSSFVQKFNNSDDIKLNVLNNISLDRTAITPVVPRPCTFRGRTIQRHSEFEGSIFDSPEIYHHTLPFQILVNDNPDVQAVSQIELSDDISELRRLEFSNIGNPSSGVSQIYHISWSINYTIIKKGNLILPRGVRFRMMRCNQDNSIDAILFERVHNNVALQSNFTSSFSGSISVDNGQFIVMTCERISFTGDPLNEGQMSGSLLTEVVYNEMSMTIDNDSVFADSVHSVILPHELFSNLMAQIVGYDGAFYSEFFGRPDIGYDYQGEGALLGITKGDLLRGVPLSETQVITTFKEAYRSYDAIFNLGLLIQDDRIRIEPKEHLFTGNVVADLGEVSELDVFPAKDFLFNSVKSGFPPVEYEAVNGRDEFNTEVQYTNAFRSVKKELDIRSVYRGDGRGIEECRRKAVSSTGTQDTRYDDKIFFVDMIGEYDSLMTRRDEGILNIEGIFSPETVINARIFPGQNLLRWSRYLSIPLHRKDKVYYFQSKEKNSGVTIVTDLGVSTDGEDLMLGGVPYFLPEHKQFVKPITVDTLFAILADPLGVIRYTYKGEKFFDMLFEVDSETERKNTEWRMLSLRPTPPEIEEDVLTGAFIKYDNSSQALIKFGPTNEELVEYQ